MIIKPLKVKACEFGVAQSRERFLVASKKLNFSIMNQLQLLKLKKLMLHKHLIMILSKVEIFTVLQIFLMKIKEEWPIYINNILILIVNVLIVIN